MIGEEKEKGKKNERKESMLTVKDSWRSSRKKKTKNKQKTILKRDGAERDEHFF